MLNLQQTDKEQPQSDHKMKMYDKTIPLNHHGPFFWTHTQRPGVLQRLQFLQSYLTPTRLRQIFVPLICMTSTISLRLINWFVITHAKQHNVVIECHPQRYVHVYQSYRTWLKYWKRGLFDAFRRGRRIYFTLDAKTYSTTVAQINYIYWAETYGILNYLCENTETISTLMTKHVQSLQQTRHTSNENMTTTTCIIYES